MARIGNTMAAHGTDSAVVRATRAILDGWAENGEDEGGTRRENVPSDLRELLTGAIEEVEDARNDLRPLHRHAAERAAAQLNAARDALDAWQEERKAAGAS